MARVRVHQHVNPLSPYYKQEPIPIDLEQEFGNPALPLHLDIGCAGAVYFADGNGPA